MNSDTFFSENIKFMELINTTDSRIMSDCTELNRVALEKFDNMLTNFKQIIQKDVRNWRQKNTDVEL